MLEKATPTSNHASSEWACHLCEEKGRVDVISVPYVFRYLVAELAAMNIRVKMNVT